MANLIWGIIGLGIALIAAVFLVRLVILNKRGIVVLAEVIAVKEKQHTVRSSKTRFKTERKTDSYIHTMRYKIGEDLMEADDRAEYIQPFEIGSTHLIICDPKNPEKFEYESDIKRNIMLFAVMAAVAVLFSLKWIFVNK
ncbi:MAG: hypothetical protein IJY19_02060 [Ruminococcus sp.]|nr:hypothetical protein [Ruminococcus sp.]